MGTYNQHFKGGAMGKLILMSTTTDSKEDCNNLASRLLEQNLIACAQISGPISSHYRWQGKIVASEEYVLQVKTVVDKAEQVRLAIAADHPYEVPEIVGVVVDDVSEDYAGWVEQEVGL